MGSSRQEHCSGLPFPFPGDISDPGTKPGSPALKADSLLSEPTEKPFFFRSLSLTSLFELIILHECVAFFFKIEHSIFKAKELRHVPSLSGVWMHWEEIPGDSSYKLSFWVWSSDVDFTFLFTLVTNVVSGWWDKKESEHMFMLLVSQKSLLSDNF